MPRKKNKRDPLDFINNAPRWAIDRKQRSDNAASRVDGAIEGILSSGSNVVITEDQRNKAIDDYINTGNFDILGDDPSILAPKPEPTPPPAQPATREGMSLSDRILGTLSNVSPLGAGMELLGRSPLGDDTALGSTGTALKGGLADIAADQMFRSRQASERGVAPTTDIIPLPGVHTLINKAMSPVTKSLNDLITARPEYQLAFKGLSDYADAARKEVEAGVAGVMADSPTRGFVERAVTDVAGSAPSTLASIPGGPFAAIPATVAKNDAFRAAREAGASWEDANDYADVMAGIEGGISAIPTARLAKVVGAPWFKPAEKALAKKIAGTGFRTVSTMLGEATEEGATEIAQDLASRAFADDTTALGEHAASQVSKDLLADTVRAAAAGAIGGGISAPMHAAEVGKEKVEQAAETIKKTQEAYYAEVKAARDRGASPPPPPANVSGEATPTPVQQAEEAGVQAEVKVGTADEKPVVTDAAITDQGIKDLANELGIAPKKRKKKDTPPTVGMKAEGEQPAKTNFRAEATSLIKDLVKRNQNQTADVQNLLRQGKLVIAPNATKVGREESDNVAEYDTETGKMYFYLDKADTSNAGELIVAALHEATHAGQFNPRDRHRPNILKQMMSPFDSNAASNKIRAAAANGNKLAIAAIEDAQKASPTTETQELELVPYFVTRAAEARELGRLSTVAKDILGDARNYVREKLSVNLDLSLNDLASASKRVAGEIVKTELKGQEGGFTLGDEKSLGMSDDNVKQFPDKRSNRTAAQLRAAEDAVRQDYVDGKITLEEMMERAQPLTYERVRAETREKRQANLGKPKEVFPGFTRIPNGTKIKAKFGFTYPEPVEGTVVGARDVQFNDGAYKVPIVRFPDGKERSVIPSDIEEVFAPRPTKSLGMVGGRRGKGFKEADAKALSYRGREDEKLRYVFSDKDAELKAGDVERDLEDGMAVPLEDAMVHDRLAQEYPALFQQMSVQVDEDLGPNEAAAQVDEEKIMISPELLQSWLHPDTRNSILHEIQHIIQYKEGHIFGSNAKVIMDPVIVNRYEKWDKSLDETIENFPLTAWMKSVDKSVADDYKQLRETEGLSLQELANMILSSGDYRASKDPDVFMYGAKYDDIREERNKAAIEYIKEKDRAFDLYKRDYGEAEARTTEFASRMSQQELDDMPFEALFGESRFNVPASKTVDSTKYMRGRREAGEPLPASQSIVFHGTPATFQPEGDGTFGKFRDDKMGSGEGAQAFGWGHYLTEDHKTADGHYRERLARTGAPQYSSDAMRGVVDNVNGLRNPDGKLAREYFSEEDIHGWLEANYIEAIEYHKERWTKANEALSKAKSDSMVNALADEIEEQEKDIARNTEALEIVRNSTLDQLDRMSKVGKEKGGELYYVDIPEKEELANWDAGLDEQVDSVKKAVKKIDPDAVLSADSSAAEAKIKELETAVGGFSASVLPAGMERIQTALDEVKAAPTAANYWKAVHQIESVARLVMNPSYNRASVKEVANAAEFISNVNRGLWEIESPTFTEWYYQTAHARFEGDEKALSKALHKEGVPGHYFQPPSRSKKTSNFVVYDPSSMKIVGRDAREKGQTRDKMTDYKDSSTKKREALENEQRWKKAEAKGIYPGLVIKGEPAFTDERMGRNYPALPDSKVLNKISEDSGDTMVLVEEPYATRWVDLQELSSRLRRLGSVEPEQKPKTLGMAAKKKAGKKPSLSRKLPPWVSGLFVSSQGTGKEINEIVEFARSSPAWDRMMAEGTFGKYTKGINKLAAERGVTPEVLADELTKKLDELEQSRKGGYEKNRAAFHRVASQYGEAGEALMRMRDQVDQLSMDVLRQRAKSSVPMTKAEKKTYKRFLKNLGRYSHRQYAIHMQKAGKDFASRIWKDYNKKAEGKKLSPAAEKNAAKVAAAVKRIVDDNLVIPEDMTQMTDAQVTSLYNQWKGNPGGTTVAQMKTQLASIRDKVNGNTDRLNSAAEDIVEEILGVTDREGLISQYYRGQKIDRGILESRKKIAPEIRELMGEIKDPAMRLFSTVAKQAEFVARNKMMLELTEANIPEHIQPPEAAGTPAVKGMEKLKGDTFGAMNGYYVSPNMKRLMSDVMQQLATFDEAVAMAANNPSRLSEKAVTEALGAWGRLAGRSKMMQIVYKPINFIYNFLGGANIMLKNGNLNPATFWKAANTAREIIAYSINPRNARPEAMRVTKHGITDSAFIGEIKAEQYQDLAETIKKMQGENPSKLWRWMKDANASVRETYAMMDVIYKIANFYDQVNVLTKYYDALGVSRTQEQIDREAADIVNRTNITYKRAAPIVKAIERGGFTNFGTYFWEVFRSELMNVKQGFDELDRAKNAPNSRARNVMLRQGMSRLAGQATVWTLLTAGSKLASQAVFGDDEEENEAIRNLLPEFVKNQDFKHIGFDKKGDAVFWDWSRIDPSGPMTDFMRLALNDDVGVDAVKEKFLDLYVTPRIGAQTYKALEAMADKSVPVTRDPLIKEKFPELYSGAAKVADYIPGVDDRMTKAWANVVETMFPGWVSGFKETNAVPVAEDGKSTLGAIATYAGATLYKLDPEIPSSMAVREYDEAVKVNRRAVKDMFSDHTYLTEEEAISRILDMREDELKAFDKVKGVYDGLLAVGYTKQEATKMFKERGLSAEAAGMLTSEKFKSNAINKDSIQRYMQNEQAGKSREEKKEIEEKWDGIWEFLEAVDSKVEEE